ncbi:hypothetical protein RGQ29_027996 [Quercus rubra]|uniref:Uncharacterized protein n=1 Tax=Quercus rubra TaxID=3512 RepID=A0AAN7IL96_QUERU|nr:hypothetical protein RGQ29_027996 [Quercus rubra]
MYPFFALGHLTPYLHLSNKLAQKGYRISFLIPTKTQSKLGTFNLYPDLITFVPITVPHVDGLPPGAETTSDVPDHLHPLIMTAMDRTESIRSILYATVSPLTVDYYTMPPAGAEQHTGNNLPEVDLMRLPSSFSVSSSIKLHVHEARAFDAIKTMKFGSGLSQCDALGLRTCREIEGPYIDNLESHFGKSVFLSGPVIPKPPTSALEEKWVKWLGRFKIRSVIYCAFGSECTLNKDQFEELVLGLELSGWPFLAALKPLFGAEKGIVHCGWVQQLLILKHPSVGCFIARSGSFFEALMNQCQLVLLPHVGDQILNARMMSNNLKVGVEVEEVRANHAKLRELLSSEDLESSYIDGFCQNLKDLVG